MLFKFLGCLSRADLSQILRSRFLWSSWQGSWVLGRHACLGRDVLDLLNIKWPIFNIQKGRVDYLVSAIRLKDKRTRTIKMAPFLLSDDVIPFLRQQEYSNSLPKYPPKFVYMDSFSELVDQLYLHKQDGWGGCCCYSDINHTDIFKSSFEERGLLDIDLLESSYRNFFNMIAEKYGEVPIVFLHFPTALEIRPKYLQRANAINAAIQKLSTEFRGLYSISVDECIVSRPIEADFELKDFPYHYNNNVYIYFANEVQSIFNKILS